MVDQERRKVLQFGIAAAVVPLVHAAPGVAGEPTAEPRSIAGPEVSTPKRLGDDAAAGPHELLAPHSPGADLGMGWTFLDLRAPDRGAMLLSLKHVSDGAVARVHLCRNSGCPAGIASTERLDFILMNGGRGDDASDEELGRVLLRVAGIVQGNEAEIALEGLQTHEERIEAWLQAEPGALL